MLAYTRLGLVFFVAFAPVAKAQISDSHNLLSLFPSSPVQVQDDGSWQTTYSTDFSPSGSDWAEGLDERDVFLAKISHLQNGKETLTLRIGRGGQFYSMRGPFGEAIAPQWRRSHDERAPWMDDVFQIVAMNTKLNLRNKTGDPETMRRAFFIHQAASYPREREYIPRGAFFSPRLASRWSSKERAFSTMNWGQQAHTPSYHKSGALFYLRIRDIGEGAFEITQMIVNVGDEPFDYLNTPWGGVRRTTFPDVVLTKPDGTQKISRALFVAKESVADLNHTGGWVTASADANDPMAQSLTIVFGKDKHWADQRQLDPSDENRFQTAATRLRFGRVGAPNIQADQRNLNTLVVNPRCIIRPGEAFFFRWFLVFGPQDASAARAAALTDQVDYGIVSYPAADSPLTPVYLDKETGAFSVGSMSDSSPHKGSDTRSFFAFEHPVEGCRGLFLLKKTENGEKFVSTDPQVFCTYEDQAEGTSEASTANGEAPSNRFYRPYDGATEILGFLGYATTDRKTLPKGQLKSLKSLIGDRLVPTPEADSLFVAEGRK